MRIALITDGAAAGRHTTDLASAFTQLGHEPVVHHIVPSVWHKRQDAVAWLVGQWQTARPAVVHCRSRVAGAAAVTAARMLAIPVVYSARPAEEVPVATVDLDVARRADHVIASCGAEFTELVVGQVPRNRISVVPHGVDVVHYTPDGDHPDGRLRHRLVTVGELTPGSGFATAVGALAGLPDTELVIAGSPQDDDHAERLRAYAQRLGVSDRLHISTRVTRATLPRLLRSADIVLVTPWEPRFGTIAIAAAACGRAVVASNTGGLTDTVVDDLTGLLVPPHRPRALAGAVWKLLARPLLREQYGASARDRAEFRYPWSQIAVDTLATYRRAGADAEAIAAISLRQTHAMT